MSVSLTYDKAAMDKFVKRIEKKTSKQTQDRILKKTAYQGMAEIAKATPKGTGETRRGWLVVALGAAYKIFNTSAVASFLHYGTGIRGPKHRVITPKNKEYLYIPLRKGAKIWRPGLVRGKDYILAKESKGIEPTKFADRPIKWTAKQLVKNFLKVLRAK